MEHKEKATRTVRVGEKGQFTIPKYFRDINNLKDGSSLSFVDLGGIFIAIPHKSEVEEALLRIENELSDQGESLESMLDTLREVRNKKA